jgi:hypothetical protein
MLSKKLYNSVNNYRNIESKVIVLYNNPYNQYDTVKNNMKKIVFSVTDKLKISPKKMIYLIVAKIEWSYTNTDSSLSSSSQKKIKLHQKLN